MRSGRITLFRSTTFKATWNPIPSCSGMAVDLGSRPPGAAIRPDRPGNPQHAGDLKLTFAANPYYQMGGFVKRCRGLNLNVKVENPRGQRIQNTGGRSRRIGRFAAACRRSLFHTVHLSWIAARVHALRIPHDTDPFGDPGPLGPGPVGAARLCPVDVLRAGGGRRLRGLGRRRRIVGTEPASRVAGSRRLDRHERRLRPPRGVDVRLLRASVTASWPKSAWKPSEY